MTHAIAYVRVSTDEQASSGLGLEAQRAAIVAAAARHGLAVAAWLEDAGASGSLDVERRPGLRDAIAALKPGSVLLVAKHDRLARDADLAGWLHHEIRRRKAAIVAAEDSADAGSSSALMERTLRQLFAAEERRRIAERTRAALAAKRTRGEKTGGHVPYGFRVCGSRLRPSKDGTTAALPTIEPDPAEQAIIARIVALWSDPTMTTRRIAATLDADGVPTRTGAAWSHQLVGKIIERSQSRAAASLVG